MLQRLLPLAESSIDTQVLEVRPGALEGGNALPFDRVKVYAGACRLVINESGTAIFRLSWVLCP